MINRFFWCANLACFLALLGGGCGGGKSCEELCNLSSGCEAVFASETPCKQQCEEREVFLKESQCGPQQELYDACRSELEDVCTVAKDCQDESLGLYDCETDYCTANPDAPSCPQQGS